VRIFFTLFVALVLTGAVSYADQKFPMTASAAVPAATGNVSVSADNNGNTKVKVNVEHLANPASLTPAQTVYVVWIQQRGSNQPDNAGVIEVGNDLKGGLETTTPYRTFDVFVTAEHNRNATSPNGPQILKATIQR
jgi:hypothetical protein